MRLLVTREDHPVDLRRMWGALGRTPPGDLMERTSETRERKYVPHAVTGAPVPVLWPEERAAQRAEKERNAAVIAVAWRCYCGAVARFRGEFEMTAGDGIDVTCNWGHRCVVRFVPERF